MPLPHTISPAAAPLQHVVNADYDRQGVALWVKRDDLLHPQVSGNKWRKLKYVVAEALAKNQTQLVTFGGAFSNHLLAVAAVGQHQKLKTVGIVRGERAPQQSATLQTCEQLGMHLHFVSRSDYRQREEAAYQEGLLAQLGGGYLIPEGGSSPLAVPGVAELWAEVDSSFHWAVTAVGTGGTVAGLAQGAPQGTSVLGIVALKGYEGAMEQSVRRLLLQQDTFDWRLEHGAHHGGYAKATPALLDFVRGWPQQHGFLLDPVYTGKVFYYLHHRIMAGYFPRGTRIMALHTGGLQGIAGFNQRFRASLPEPE